MVFIGADIHQLRPQPVEFSLPGGGTVMLPVEISRQIIVNEGVGNVPITVTRDDLRVALLDSETENLLRKVQ